VTFFFVVLPAFALTLATFVLALLVRLGIALARRPAPRFWPRALYGHAALFVLHLLLVVPLGLGLFGATHVQTRPDERGYTGPRLDADGRWLVQSRESLVAEARGAAHVDPALVAAARERAVRFRASDGVELRAFLVPPVPPRPADSNSSAPRFVAVLVHGLYRGALELEPVGSMLRDLGGEVLLLEMRNHGGDQGSGRARPTFGRDESLDVVAAAQFLTERPEARGRPLVLFAVSLGTAAATFALPQLESAGLTPSTLILDAPIVDVRAAADRMLGGSQGRRRVQGIAEPFRSTMLWSAEHLGGVPFAELDGRDVLVHAAPRLPILLIGAGHDDRAPPDVVQQLFDLLPSDPTRKELWIEPDADHGKVWLAKPDEYRARVTRFVERHALHE
jgi:hypothetical protein